MSKFWVCDKCLPEEVEELSIGSLLKTPCVVCGEAKEPNEMKCVRFLPERLEKKLGLRRNLLSVEKMNSIRDEAELEKMKGAIAAALQVPREYLEPALTWSATALVAAKEDAEHAKRARETIERMKPEVDTDGRTVWVNAPNCIGRFCPVSGEVMKADGRVLGTPPYWREWQALMLREHGCVIDEKYQPEWSKGRDPQAKQEG